MNPLIICFDIDGVLAVNTLGTTHTVADIVKWTNDDWHKYFDQCVPNKDLIDKIKVLHSLGHIIKLFTARADTHSIITEDWLHRFEVPYHSIQFNKPTADVYFDDRAFQFTTAEEAMRLISNEVRPIFPEILHMYPPKGDG